MSPRRKPAAVKSGPGSRGSLVVRTRFLTSRILRSSRKRLPAEPHKSSHAKYKGLLKAKKTGEGGRVGRARGITTTTVIIQQSSKHFEESGSSSESDDNGGRGGDGGMRSEGGRRRGGRLVGLTGLGPVVSVAAKRPEMRSVRSKRQRSGGSDSPDQMSASSDADTSDLERSSSPASSSSSGCDSPPPADVDDLHCTGSLTSGRISSAVQPVGGMGVAVDQLPSCQHQPVNTGSSGRTCTTTTSSTGQLNLEEKVGPGAEFPDHMSDTESDYFTCSEEQDRHMEGDPSSGSSSVSSTPDSMDSSDDNSHQRDHVLVTRSVQQ
jgi:hypothetical protein